jgi:hypothetical protein
VFRALDLHRGAAYSSRSARTGWPHDAGSRVRDRSRGSRRLAAVRQVATCCTSLRGERNGCGEGEDLDRCVDPVPIRCWGRASLAVTAYATLTVWHVDPTPDGSSRRAAQPSGKASWTPAWIQRQPIAGATPGSSRRLAVRSLATPCTGRRASGGLRRSGPLGDQAGRRDAPTVAGASELVPGQARYRPHILAAGRRVQA